VFDYGQEEGHHFIVMELVDGPDLARLLREEGPFEPDRAIRMATEAAEALGHAHGAGVIHRDIKPANIMVAPDGRVKVTDFGIARALGDATMTATGSVLGTANYISPEQAEGGRIGPPSDIYSLGIVLYEMLTGAVPFTAESPLGVAMRHISDPLPAPSELNPDVPPRLDEIVARATAKAPEDRFRDTTEMIAALRGDGAERGAGAAALGGAAAAAGTTAVLDDAEPVGATAALDGAAAETWRDPAQTVWPIPGNRWDPAVVGKAVIAGLAALALLAIGLLVLKIADADPQRAVVPDATPKRQEPAVESSDIPTTTMPYLIGFDRHDAEERLKDMDMGLVIEPVEEYNDAYAAHQVFATSPTEGSPLSPGDTITLSVSLGPEPVDEDEEEDKGGPGNSGDKGKKGKGKD
ncbi:MAG: protein kinase, partial [Actinomycetota bacterium]